MLSFGFILISSLVFILLFILSGRDLRLLFASVIWILLITILANSDFFLKMDTIPPRFIIVLIGGVSLAILCDQFLKNKSIPIEAILLIHVVRIPVEISLHQLYKQGEIPKIMTYEGWNFDIIMGISALVLIAISLVGKKHLNRKMLLLWNFLGILLLTIIVVVALLSAPFPFQQLAFDQPNKALLNFPFILLPAYIVPVVYLAHALAIRTLLKKSDLI